MVAIWRSFIGCPVYHLWNQSSLFCIQYIHKPVKMCHNNYSELIGPAKYLVSSNHVRCRLLAAELQYTKFWGSFFLPLVQRYHLYLSHPRILWLCLSKFLLLWKSTCSIFSHIHITADSLRGFSAFMGFCGYRRWHYHPPLIVDVVRETPGCCELWKRILTSAAWTSGALLEKPFVRLPPKSN